MVDQQSHDKEVEKLNDEIQFLKQKYRIDIQSMQDKIVRILKFTDLERKVAEHTNIAWASKLQLKREKLRALTNILRTPRLTSIYQREIRKTSQEAI